MKRNSKISFDDIEMFHDYKILVTNRIMYVGSESYDSEGTESGTDSFMVGRFIKNMEILESINHQPIEIIMNNCGGDIHSGMGIYDRIMLSPCHITIKVFGEASSMGSVILQAADKRLMSPNAVQIIHYGAFSVGAEAKSAYRFVDEFKRIDKFMEKLYMAKIKKKDPLYKLGRLQRLLEHDTYLTAQQSVDLGLADGIIPIKNK